MFKAVSASDFAPLNTDGAALPIFSVRAQKQQSERFTLHETVSEKMHMTERINTHLVFHHCLREETNKPQPHPYKEWNTWES